MSIDEYRERFRLLRPKIENGREKPHKICMLLAVLDLAKSGVLEENKIFFTPALVERYKAFFAAAAALNDRPNPHYPFFFLRGKLSNESPSFWHLQARPGREDILPKLEVRTLSDLTENIEFAWLDENLFDLLKDVKNIELLEETLTSYWFDRGYGDLRSIVESTSAISQYERNLRQHSLGAPIKREPASIRTPAFRRLITQIYDYRCVATGLRILLPTGESMVEAAHIRPFNETYDDDPRNGLALTPNIHWAMDRNLIAPGPDMIWHVSSVLDRRIADFQTLIALDGRPLLRPRESRFTPKKESLAWRLERLRRH